MTAVIACLPCWYLTGYIRGEETARGTFVACFLAVARALVSAMLWPMDITWRTLLKADTVMYELMAIGTEISFLCWLWIGSGHPHLVMFSIPMWGWMVILTTMISNHIYVLRSWERDLRAIAIIFDVLGYVWLGGWVLRSRFYFGEVFLWVFALMGVIAVLILRSSPVEADHGG